MKKTLEQFKSMSKKNKIILVSILAGIILIFGATTYAFFSSTIIGDKQPLSVQTGTLILEFNDAKDSGIREEEIALDNEITKEMMITNTGTLDATATIMWNELENTYLDKSLMYTVKRTEKYDKDAVVDADTLEYNEEVPEARTYVPRSEEPQKIALTGGLNIPAGKKIYYRLTITYNHLNDDNQTSDFEAQLSTSFTIEEGDLLPKLTITKENRSLIGYKGNVNEWLGIPVTYQDENGILYKVTEIGENAFSSCSSLTSITIPNSVTSIGNFAFSSCSSLKTVTIPNSVTIIGANAFYYCSSLKTVTIPNSVTSIRERAFTGCSSLTSVTIPDSVTNIVSSPFSSCSSLTSINVDENNKNYKSIDGVLFTKDEKTLIQCPGGKIGDYSISDSVSSISNDAFDGCGSLTSITIPDSVTSIGSGAFQCCTNLTSITIPDNVTSIDGWAFQGCYNLASVVYKGTTYTSQSAFKGAFTSTNGNTIGSEVFEYTKLNA